MSKACFQIFIAGFFCLLFACKSDDPYLYDKVGFSAGTRPENVENPNAPAHVAPDYYYRQPTGYPQQGSPQAIAPQTTTPQTAQTIPPQAGYPTLPYQYQQPYYPPQYQGSYYSQAAPGSRFYSNPYALPPSNYYPTYDADQYYVPPAYYQNTEPQSQSPARPKQ
jgi:hypothetical protein